MKRTLLIALAAFAILTLPAAASQYAPSLEASPNPAQVGQPYVISGCGYVDRLVTVVVYTPQAAAWTAREPVGGCFSVDNFSAQGPGLTRIEAWQVVHGKKASVVARTTFDVVP